MFTASDWRPTKVERTPTQQSQLWSRLSRELNFLEGCALLALIPFEKLGALIRTKVWAEIFVISFWKDIHLCHGHNRMVDKAKSRNPEKVKDENFSFSTEDSSLHKSLKGCSI